MLPSVLKSLLDCASSNDKPIVVLFGLEYAHAIPHIREKLVAGSSTVSESDTRFLFADVICSEIDPRKDQNSDEQCKTNDVLHVAGGSRHKIGGLIWSLPLRRRIDDYLLLWIGSGNSAFANVVLTSNNCEIVRHDAKENQLVTDLSQQRRILKRRYYLVEKAKDANIVGIVVGTLGVESKEEYGVLALAKTIEKALQLRDGNSTSIIKGTIKSGEECYATRTYHGLEMHGKNSTPEPYLIGRSGKSSGYQNEKQDAG